MIDPQQVEDYLENTLAPEDRRTFEEQMARDPALREEVLNQMRINLALAALSGKTGNTPVVDSVANAVTDKRFADGVVRDLKRILAEEPREKIVPVSRRQFAGWWLAAAAGVAVFASFWFLGKRAQPAWSAHLKVISGEVLLHSRGKTNRVQEQVSISPGDQIEVAANGLAVLHYTDSTLVELRPETVLSIPKRSLPAERGRKMLVLERGALFADVQPQSPGHSMIITTATAKAEVLGTRFLLVSSPSETRLQVQRGKVQLAPFSDNQAIDVLGGHTAVSISAPVPLLQISSTSRSRTNLAQNAGMELDSNEDGLPDYWGAPSPPYWTNQIARDTAVFRSGEASLRAVGPTPFIYVWQSISLEPNKTYLLSVWVKTFGVSTMDAVRERYSQIEPSTIVWRNEGTRGTTDWVHRTTTFTTSANYQCGRLDLTWELGPGEIAWFDDVELVEFPSQNAVAKSAN